MDVRRVGLSDLQVEPVLTGLAQEYQRRYGESTELATTDAAEFDPPNGAFLLLQEDDQTVAGGGFRRVDDHTAEIKRMWTHPARRRRGLAGVVLSELESLARNQGYQRLVLETGPAQPEAQACYVNNGYRATATYGRYPNAVAFERKL